MWFFNAQSRKNDGHTARFDLHYAHIIKNEVESRGLKDPIINAEVYVTLNGSRSKLFIDPEVDLTTLQDDFKPKDWILDN